MRKPTICICENKDADQLRGNVTAKLITAFIFATWIVQSLYFLNTKKIKPLAISSDCTAWFVSELVRNHIVGFLTSRLNLLRAWEWEMLTVSVYKLSRGNTLNKGSINVYSFLVWIICFKSIFGSRIHTYSTKYDNAKTICRRSI